MKNPSVILFSAILISGVCLRADDFGTHGVIYPIEEEDPIQLIQQKLKAMEERGELERHNKELQKKTKASVERPKPVEGITRATESRVFYFNPTHVVREDLKDHLGQVFAKKGTKINPLETVSLSQNLLFFDGDDLEQKEYAQQQFNIEKEKLKLILIKGAPLVLSEEWQVPVYFDQGGLLTKKLGIKHVPALVTQEGLQLRIEEIFLGETE
ncbi:MAG: type-F conjugative transfer system protein TraW [Alphaproteobacteria bacterium 41-28]|nr:MAG: type-F conjugative transfer system protein TraW [Alphaproteobacteria bacterium 41-28]